MNVNQVHGDLKAVSTWTKQSRQGFLTQEFNVSSAIFLYHLVVL